MYGVEAPLAPAETNLSYAPLLLPASHLKAQTDGQNLSHALALHFLLHPFAREPFTSSLVAAEQVAQALLRGPLQRAKVSARIVDRLRDDPQLQFHTSTSAPCPNRSRRIRATSPESKLIHGVTAAALYYTRI